MTGVRVAFRVDASSAMGIGHVKRCLSLAQALKVCGADPVFVARRLDGTAARLIEEVGFTCHLLKPTCALAESDAKTPSFAVWSDLRQASDAAETTRMVKAKKPHWVIVDHYALDARWHGHVRRITGARIAAIDDLADRPMAVDLLIDHNIADDHRAKYAGRVSRKTRILGGPRYALLDPSYATAPRYEFRPKVASIGIFMGGTDSVGATPIVVEACRAHARFQGRIEVVTTSSNPGFDSLRAACARWAQTDLTVDLPTLSGFFARHDLQIGAGGGAVWERCCIGAPTVALACADNQVAVVQEIVHRGVAASTPSPDPGVIGSVVADLCADADWRRRLHETSAALVDGRGAERVALALTRGAMTVRAARITDAVISHRWRNDPRTRATAHVTASFEWVMHLDWWKTSLQSSTRKLLIGCCGAREVGVVRFDCEGSNALVSIYLDPDITGLGLGVALLEAGRRWLLHNQADVIELQASIRRNNIASQAAFRAAGYTQVGEIDWRLRLGGESPTPIGRLSTINPRP